MRAILRFASGLVKPADFRDPPFVRHLLGDPLWSWIWLLARLYVGYKWIDAGWHKLNDPRWISTGEALHGFWARAVKIPDPPARPAITYDWYRDFIEMLLDGEHYIWFAKLISVGEFTVGIALVLGAFVGMSAFAGAFMNWNFMMAGTASINPVLFALSILLILAWKTAGWLGLDRWLLPALGTPWEAGRLFRKNKASPTVPGSALTGGSGGARGWFNRH